ncbi:hypothetical protein [Burkholderia ambifaria]|uniref:hypothetical protein n=1 Tax=Burkholderia ambifaria TaxID=152480 RepID=UPI000F7FED0F|nr:hypothetical protein [Burkholderia ambifaria]
MVAEKKHRLTEAQKAVLRNLEAGLPWDSHLSGRSAYGGARATVQVLKRLGYMAAGGIITDAGRAALNNIAGK